MNTGSRNQIKTQIIGKNKHQKVYIVAKSQSYLQMTIPKNRTTRPIQTII